MTHFCCSWRSRQQRSVAQPLATDAELRPNDDRNGKHAVSQAYKDGLNASFAAEKQPSPKEYFEQTDLCKNYNFLHQSFPEHQPQQQLQLQQTQQQHPQRMSSSFITNYTKCSSKNDFYPLSWLSVSPYNWGLLGWRHACARSLNERRRVEWGVKPRSKRVRSIHGDIWKSAAANIRNLSSNFEGLPWTCSYTEPRSSVKGWERILCEGQRYYKAKRSRWRKLQIHL